MKNAKYTEGQTWSGVYQGYNEDVPTTVTIVDATQTKSKFKFDTTPAYTVRITREVENDLFVPEQTQRLREGELERELRIIGALE